MWIYNLVRTAYFWNNIQRYAQSQTIRKAHTLKVCVSKKTTGSKQDSQNKLLSLMPYGGRP